MEGQNSIYHALYELEKVLDDNRLNGTDKGPAGVAAQTAYHHILNLANSNGIQQKRLAYDRRESR